MKKIIVLFISIACIFSLTACTTNDNDAASSDESSMSEAPSSSLAAPSSQTSSKQLSSSSEAPSSQASSGQPSSSSNAPSSASQSQASSVSSVPEAPSAPTIKSSKFYENTQGSSLSLLCTDYMRFGLSHEDAKKYISGIDFSNFTPATKQYSIGIDDDISGGAVIMTNSDFSHQLRLDKKNGIAVYSENGSLYYYTITADFYSSVYNRTADYSKYDFTGNPNEGIENEENPDVVTG